MAVEHIRKRVTKNELISRMLSIIRLKKDYGFKKNFKKFVQSLAEDARLINRQNSVTLVNTKEVFGVHVECAMPCGLPPQ